jgi:peptide/nickel transport system permease protein
VTADLLPEKGDRRVALPSTRDQPPKEEEIKEVYFASQWKLIWWKFRKHRLAIISAPILIMLYLSAVFADFISPHLPTTRLTKYKAVSPQRLRFYTERDGLRRPFIYEIERETDPETFRRYYVENRDVLYPVTLFARGEPYRLLGLFPTDIHLFGADGPLLLLGSDTLGRDVFTRILYGSRISLSVGLVGVSLTFALGMLLGGISGYLGGVVDMVIQRVIDLLVCMPTAPLWMSLAAALPRNWPTLRMYMGIVVITSVIGWGGLARVVRGKFLSLRELDFCMAARLAGASDMHIILRHLLPSMASYIIVSLTLSIPRTILGETALSFLGLGLQPPVVSWGVLLRDAQDLSAVALHPWLLLPSLWVVATVLMYNFLGDGLRDAADPYR